MYTEGLAKIYSAKGSFLNPLGRVSRDISTAYVGLFAGGDLKVLDATAATGIRAIRYAKEAGAKNICAIEMNKKAYLDMAKNVKRNNVVKKIELKNIDLQRFANSGENTRFDIIDLDPFGGITPYIYDLMKLSHDSTRLMVTATDTAVLCGAHKMACLRLYNSKPIHNNLCHEASVRIMINYILKNSAQFNMGIEVELAIVHMHYIRVFLKLTHGAKKAMDSIFSSGYLHNCSICGYWEIERNYLPSQIDCAKCAHLMNSYGPMWLGSMKDANVTSKVADKLSEDNSANESKSIMSIVNGELDVPFYYHIPEITKRLKLGSISPNRLANFLSDELGLKSTQASMYKSSIKTLGSYDDVLYAAKECIKNKN